MRKYLGCGTAFKVFLCACVLVFYAVALAQPITLASADLGRHLKNGEIFVRTGAVPQGNYYSYTYPDYPFINHHWGSGVMFYLVQRLAGFAGLHLFIIAVSAATLGIFLSIGIREGNFVALLFSAILAVPLAASRAEIRPEAFSYLLAGIFFWIILNYVEGKILRRWLWLLPVLMALWINLHIYFFFGFALIALAMLEVAYRWMMQKRRDCGERLRSLALAGVASGIAALANPAGIRGVLYPLKIFNNYGYRLLENQSVWFLDRVISYPPSLYFKMLFAVLAVACGFFLIRVWQKKETFSLFFALLAIGVSILGWTAVRNFSLFGFFAIPLTAIFFRSIAIKKDFSANRAAGIIGAAGLLFISLFVISPAFWDRYKDGGWGIGLRQSAGSAAAAGAADFFLREHLAGPIFNDYDIGGYLIYYLFPGERVFTDNRPEAYPASFFDEVYVPMQENEEKWREGLARFGFNAIIFYWHDLTPWAQNFLMHRIADDAWAPVYVDDAAIVFLRRGGINQPVIDKYEIPRSAFRSIPSL